MDNWQFFKLSGHKLTLTLLFIGTLALRAQTFDFKAQTIKLMNDLNQGDSTAFCAHFHPLATLYHLGDNGLEQISLAEFSKVLKKFKAKEYQEDFTTIEVNNLNTGVAHLDVHFTFYINEKVAFSGIDHVVWIFEGSSYRIHSLYTSALKPSFTTSNGSSQPFGQLDVLMNTWHADVAAFKYDAYFGFMAESFIFLGTDPSERWTKTEFADFCKPHFEKKSTWDFKTNWRNWYLSEDQNTAWFEESLETQMDECRGSGVLIKENDVWKIAHYNLSVTIENEKMDKFLKLRKK